jgi:hypothetical protein
MDDLDRGAGIDLRYLPWPSSNLWYCLSLHKLLHKLQILRILGISGPLLRWFAKYLTQIWSHCSYGSICRLRNLQRVQRRATRVILRKPELCYGTQLIQLHLLPLSYFLEYLDLLFCFRCLKVEILLSIFSVFIKDSKGIFPVSFLLVPLPRPLWSALPFTIFVLQSRLLLSILVSCLTLLFTRLNSIFYHYYDNIRTWRIVCPNLTSICPSIVIRGVRLTESLQK